MILGTVMKQLRLRAGLTQSDVCKRANLTQGFYSAIENGGPLSLDTLYRLAEVFKVPVFVIVWMATEKRDIPKPLRGWYNDKGPIIDSIIDLVTPKQKNDG
jgi:transcriptional regulator with XRE-family HTH domain